MGLRSGPTRNVKVGFTMSAILIGVAEKDTLNQIGLYKMLVEQLNQWTLNFNQENEIVFLVALSGFTILQEQGSINQVLSNKYFLKWI
jgi:hypothetical protein